jgi:hypothetical protein
MVALALLLILAIWLAIALILIAIGQLLLRILQGEPRLVDSFWTGLATSVAFLEAWHLLLPVTSAATLLLLIPAALGCLLARASVLRQLRNRPTIAGKPAFLYAVIVALLALRAVGPCTYYDTGLYGATAVRWTGAYPAVPGLANLHGRLGFDSAVVLCIAALGPSQWPDLGHHIFPGLIVAAIWASVLPAWCKAWRRSQLTPSDWFLAILMIPVANWTLRWPIVGTVTDVPASTAALLAIAILIERLTDPPAVGAADKGDPPARPAASGSRLVVVASLCSLAVAFKLSTAAIAGAAWTAGFLWILHHRRARNSDHRPRLWFVYLAIPAIVLVPWVFGNIMTSGYPFYPSTILPVHVDWLVPAAAARRDSDMIRSWARIPNVPLEKTAGWSWMGPWFVRSLATGVSFTRPIFISAAAIGCLVVFRVRRIGRRSDSGPWLWMLVPALVGLGFWFWAAPDPRFGESAIWATTGILATWVLSIIDGPGRRPFSRCVAIGIALVALTGLGPPMRLFRDQYKAIFTSRPLASLRVAPVSKQYTRSGLLVYVPVAPSKDDRTWGAPLPNTPYFNPDLALRNPADMRWGFTMTTPHPPTAPLQLGNPIPFQFPAVGDNAAAPPTSRTSP